MFTNIRLPNYIRRLTSDYGIMPLHVQEQNKKHIDASVKERPQTPLVPSEDIYKRVLCNKHI